MPPNQVCPRCGLLLMDGRCPSCEASRTSPTGPSRAPGSASETRFIVLALVAFLVLAGVVASLSFIVFRRLGEQLAQSHPGQTIYARHVGPVARLDELKGTGRIYLVQMGEHKDPYSLEDFAHWLQTKYALEVHILPPTPLDPNAWNAARRQYAAEMLDDQLKHDHPDLALDPDAYLIGFTDADMYTTQNTWRSTFTLRDLRRVAVISSDGMQDTPLQTKLQSPGRSPADAVALARQHFQARLRRILLKDVALLYWNLPFNSDSTSLLHSTLDPDMPAEDIYESDLDPARSPHGELLYEPCLLLDYSARRGIHLRPGRPIRECSDVSDPEQDATLETFELDLHLGMFMDKRTDFFLPDSIPIRFQRVTRAGWKGIAPFGISGTDSYDEYLSSADNIDVDVVRADGGRDILSRSPRWLSDLSFVKYVDNYNPGLYEMRWHAGPYEHYDVTRFDGAVMTFLPCTGPHVWCYLTDYHDFAGRQLKFVRGPQRRLERLTSPSQNWLQIDYDPVGRIAQVTDNLGRVVRYGYDSANRLTSVTYPSGERCIYEYDDAQNLLTFSASPDASTPPHVILHNQFSNGLLVKQTLEDGSVYSYSYVPEILRQVSSVVVHTPDGKVFTLKIGGNFAAVHEQ